MDQIVFFVLLGAMMVGMLVLSARTNKKKEQKAREMLEQIQVGDEIITKGGIIGIVVSIKEDTFMIETGAERNKIRIKKWAVYQNETIRS